MPDMNFKVNLLPNSNLGQSLGSSDKKWNIYGTLTGYSSNAISWNDTNKKLKQTISSNGAEDVLSFVAGDGIALTADATSLTISANTTTFTPSTNNTYYYPIFNDQASSNDPSLLKYDTYKIAIHRGTTSAYGSTQIILGNNKNSTTDGNSRGYISLYSTGTNLIHISPSSGSYNTSYNLPSLTPLSRWVVSVPAGSDYAYGKVGAVDLPVYIDTYGVPKICEFNAVQSSTLSTISPLPAIVHTSTGLASFTDITLGQDLDYAYMQIGGSNSYTVLGETRYLGGKLSLNLKGNTPKAINLQAWTPTSGNYYSTSYMFYPSANNTDTSRIVVHRPLDGSGVGVTVGSSTIPVYIGANGEALACTLDAGSVGLGNVTNDAQITNIGLVTGESTPADNGITKTVSNTTSVAITQADLQSAIFVISDTAPTDTSVIWLKPVSSTT